MDITVTRSPAPTIPPHIEAALLAMSPRVFMRWNGCYRKTDRMCSAGKPVWEGRWEIWIECADTSHPDAQNERVASDIWNHEAQCWMRKLQTYTNADGSFAPLDERLLVGLELADTWNNRRFYEENVEDPYNKAEVDNIKARREIYEGGANYYKDHDRLLVGPHVNSGWRWRTR